MSENIYNERGILRADLEKVQVPPERRPVFEALLSAVKAEKIAESEFKIAESAVAEAVKVHAAAVATYKPSTFMDEWRTMVGQGAMTQPVNEEGTVLPETDLEAVSVGTASPQVPPHQVVRNATAALDAARHNLRVARDKLAKARENVGRKLAEYNQATPTISAEQNVRDWIASNNAARAARAGANGHYTPNVTATARAMGGGGHGNDIRTSRGGGAAFRRGPGGVKAYSKAQAAEINATRAREARIAGSNAPRVKLPSEK